MSEYTKEQILQICLHHKDKFFEEQGFFQQSGQKLVSDSIVKNVLLGTGKEIIFQVYQFQRIWNPLYFID